MVETVNSFGTKETGKLYVRAVIPRRLLKKMAALETL
jgi:hypothetical protein